MKPLDPIVSLTVAIAEAAGSYAFLLGSGVSRDAGVPTGAEVFWIGVEELYRLENDTAVTPDRDDLIAWLEETGRSGMAYSDLLELMAPDPATRRDYLAKHFDGAEPSVTHQRLAKLCAAGAIRVFITTNFDRLLEQALRAEGIEPVVVTCDADLLAAPRREHARCFILKPHGDYLQETIRNTPAELATLEPAMSRELQDVLDRYGVVVVGYSGSDEAIGTALRARQARYGLYWVSRSSPGASVAGILDAVGGRSITRPSAAEFLAEIDRKLAVFRAEPSGDTPVSVCDETTLLLRRDDRVGLSELQRRERRAFEERILVYIAERRSVQPSEDVILAAYREFLPVIERRLASLLPLVSHDHESLADEVSALSDFAGRVPRQGGLTFWPELPLWCVWRLAYTCGAFACRARQYRALRPLFHTRRAHEHYNDQTEPIVESRIWVGSLSIGAFVVGTPENGGEYHAPDWECLLRDLPEMALLKERYPELVSDEGQPLQSMIAFDFILGMALGIQGDEEMAHWAMYERDAEQVAMRLRADTRSIEQVAYAIGVSVEDFPSQAVQGLEKTHNFRGSWPRDRRAIRVLRSMLPDGEQEAAAAPV